MESPGSGTGIVCNSHGPTRKHPELRGKGNCSGNLSLAFMTTNGYSSALSSTESDRAFLLTRASSPLFEDVKARWTDRKFHRLKVLTGFTDESGALIRDCVETFGVQECVVVASRRGLSFDPAKFKAFPPDVRISFWPEESSLHAKFLWFEGPDGCAAIAGSANCSKTAWLLHQTRV